MRQQQSCQARYNRTWRDALPASGLGGHRSYGDGADPVTTHDQDHGVDQLLCSFGNGDSWKSRSGAAGPGLPTRGRFTLLFALLLVGVVISVSHRRSTIWTCPVRLAFDS